LIVQATASRWSSFYDQWLTLVRMWPLIELSWAASKRDCAQLPSLNDVKALMYVFVPVEKALKAVCFVGFYFHVLWILCRWS
jgi:hypothetical protein